MNIGKELIKKYEVDNGEPFGEIGDSCFDDDQGNTISYKDLIDNTKDILSEMNDSLNIELDKGHIKISGGASYSKDYNTQNPAPMLAYILAATTHIGKLDGVIMFTYSTDGSIIEYVFTYDGINNYDGCYYENQEEYNKAICERKGIEYAPDESIDSSENDLLDIINNEEEGNWLDKYISITSDKSLEKEKVRAKSMNKKAIEEMVHADNLYANNQIDEAIESYKKVIMLDKELPDAYYGLGSTYFQKGKKEESKEWCKKTIELDPGHYKAFNLLGEVNITIYHLTCSIDDLENSNLKDAIRCFKKASDLKPDYDVPLFNLGCIYSECFKNYDKAIELFTKCLEINPTFHWGHKELGEAYLKAGNSKKAIECFEKGLSIEPDLMVYVYLLGEAYEKSGDRNKAITYFTQAAKSEFELAILKLEEYDSGNENVDNDTNRNGEEITEDEKQGEIVDSNRLILVQTFLHQMAQKHLDFKPVKGKTYGHENAGNGCLFAINVLKDKIGVEFVSKGKFPPQRVIDFVNKTGITEKKMLRKYEVHGGAGKKNLTHIRFDCFIPIKSDADLSKKEIIDDTLKMYDEFKKIFENLTKEVDN